MWSPPSGWQPGSVPWRACVSAWPAWRGCCWVHWRSPAGAWITGTLPRYLPPFSATLDYVSSVAKFALVAAPLGCAVTALAGVFSLGLFAGPHTGEVWQPLGIWWLGELLGVYLIAPLLLTTSRWDLLPTNKAARLEGLVLVLGMLLLTRVMMEYVEPLRPAEIVLFILMPGVWWAALRFSVTGASLAIFLAALIVLGVSVVSFGGLTIATMPRDVFALQLSMMTMALGGLFVSAALTERRYSEMRLDMLANHDPLTGLPNRSYFQDFLSHALARAQREKFQVSLLFIDLDRFKHINDSQGHEVGDQVLRVVANRLDEQLRADDFVARLGGDEFAVVLAHPPASRAASRVARKLLKTLAESFRLDRRRYAIGASIGISVFPDFSHLPRPGEKPGASAPNRFYMYGVIARLAMLAASYELEATDRSEEHTSELQ